MNWAGDWIQNNISETDTVIDFGCGVMQSTIDIVPTYPRTKLKCKRLVGVDIYKPYLDKLNERGIETVLWDLTKTPYPFEDKSFDVGILTDIFEHLPNMKAVDNLIKEAKRITRKKLFVITPVTFFDNKLSVEKPPFPYDDMGSNEYQEHHILIGKSYLEEHGFEVSQYSNHYVSLAKLFNKIVHIWDCAGVASIMSKYQRQLGYDSKVITNKNKDGYGFNGVYSDVRVRYVSALPDPIKIKNSFIKKIIHQYKFFKRLMFAMQGMNPDIIHFHSLDFTPIWFKLIGCNVLVEFHGTKIRTKYEDGRINKLRHTPRWIFRIYGLLRIPIFVSTSDLLKDVPLYNRPKKISRLIDNPVDRDIFTKRDSVNKNSALYCYNHYDMGVGSVALSRSDEHGLKLVIYDRTNFHLNHIEFSKWLKEFDFYIDRINIGSLSKTALESLALGLKVIDWKGDVIEDLPIQHEPFNVARKTIEIYNKILSNQI